MQTLLHSAWHMVTAFYTSVLIILGALTKAGNEDHLINPFTMAHDYEVLTLDCRLLGGPLGIIGILNLCGGFLVNLNLGTFSHAHISELFDTACA